MANELLLTRGYLLFNTSSPAGPVSQGDFPVREKRGSITAWGSRELGRCLAMALDTWPPGLALLVAPEWPRAGPFPSLGLSLDIHIMRDWARRALGARLAFRL